MVVGLGFPLIVAAGDADMRVVWVARNVLAAQVLQGDVLEVVGAGTLEIEMTFFSSVLGTRPT